MEAAGRARIASELADLQTSHKGFGERSGIFSKGSLRRSNAMKLRSRKTTDKRAFGAISPKTKSAASVVVA